MIRDRLRLFGASGLCCFFTSRCGRSRRYRRLQRLFRSVLACSTTGCHSFSVGDKYNRHQCYNYLDLTEACVPIATHASEKIPAARTRIIRSATKRRKGLMLQLQYIILIVEARLRSKNILVKSLSRRSAFRSIINGDYNAILASSRTTIGGTRTNQLFHAVCRQCRSRRRPLQKCVRHTARRRREHVQNVL